jgi:hypothetical protein
MNQAEGKEFELLPRQDQTSNGEITLFGAISSDIPNKEDPVG